MSRIEWFGIGQMLTTIGSLIVIVLTVNSYTKAKVGAANKHTDEMIRALEIRFELIDKLSAARFERILSESRIQADLMVQELRHEIEMKEDRLGPGDN